MKKLVFALTLGLASSALAGGNDGVWVFSNKQMAMSDDVVIGDTGMTLAEIGAKVFPGGNTNGVVVIPGVGPIVGPGGTPVGPGVPGGTDGSYAETIKKALEAIEADGGVETKTTLKTMSGSDVKAVLWNQVVIDAQESSLDKMLAMAPGNSDGGSGITISALKYLAESETTVSVQVNYMNQIVTMPDTELAKSTSLMEAVSRSVEVQDWVQVK